MGNTDQQKSLNKHVTTAHEPSVNWIDQINV